MTENKTPSIKLKELRIKAGLSQNKLAKLAEVSQSHISEIESGVKRVSLDVTRKLARALEVPFMALISEDFLEESEEEIEQEQNEE